jgi:predicted ATP-dependent endonuclease of OLD family
MSSIKIRNFGAIKSGYSQGDGFLKIPKVTVFVGNQGSGKSTIAKLISTFSWMEKVLVRGDYDAKWFTPGKFQNTYLAYHRLENYFHPNSELAYIGDAYSINYKNGVLQITEQKSEQYALPQIMYVPAERNFVANSEESRKYKDLSESLVEFLGEYTKALKNLKEPIPLPINNTSIEYDKSTDTVHIRGKDYRIKLSESASGFQSVAPLYLVSHYLSHAVRDLEKSATMSSDEKSRFEELTSKILSDSNLTDRQKRIAISEIGKTFNKTAFINIIEEPEQNLFPSSQWQMLQSLLAFNNSADANKLIMTTHSPYIINYLTLAVKAAALQKNCTPGNIDAELRRVVSLDALFNSADLAIYELTESDGTIRALETYDGLPSDENQLNNQLEESNEAFAELLEIQQKSCR